MMSTHLQQGAPAIGWTRNIFTGKLMPRRGRGFILGGEHWLVVAGDVVPVQRVYFDGPAARDGELAARAWAAGQLAAHLADCFPSTAGRLRYHDARRLAQRLTHKEVRRAAAG